MKTEAAVFVAASAAIASAATFVGSYQGHDYYVTDAESSVFDARMVAVNLGGHLVTINDQAEQDWLNAELGFTTFYWIGYSDEIQEGVFVWDSGEVSGYTFFAPGEPNNFQGTEDHVVMNWTSDGRWNDGDGSDRALAIIEVVPAPGASVLAVVGLGVAARRRR